MRISILLVFFVLYFSNHAQIWGDSLVKAQELYKKKEFDKSIALYNKAKVDVNEEMKLQKERAQSAYRSEDFNLANKSYEGALLNVTNALEESDLLFNQGNTLLKMGDYDEAIRKYKASILKNPINQDAKYNLSQALRQKNSQSSSTNEQDSSESNSDQNQNRNRDKPQSKENFSLENHVTERTLKELLQKAQETKRKLVNQKTNSNKNSKDW